MKIIRNALAGSLESSDCLVKVCPAETLKFHLDSTLDKRFGSHLRKLVQDTLRELHVESGEVVVTDRGALDYCIRARLATAARRGGAC